MPAVVIGDNPSENIKNYKGLSVDIKPIDCGTGSSFYEMDTGDIFVYVPSIQNTKVVNTWAKLQDYLSSPQSTLNITSAQITNSVFPEYFGAKADGISSDDSAFISAISYCITNNTSLIIGNKTYFLSNPLDTNGINILGINKFNSIIKGTIKIGSYQELSNFTLIGRLTLNNSSCTNIDFINCILDGDQNKYSQFSIADGEVQYLSFKNCEFRNGTYALNFCNKGDAFHIHHIYIKNCYFHDNIAMNLQFIGRYYTKENIIYGYNNILIEDSEFIGVSNASQDSQTNISFDGYFYGDVKSDNSKGLLLCRDIAIRNCTLLNGFHSLENAGAGNMTIDNCIIERNYYLDTFLISCSGNIRLPNKDVRCNLVIKNSKLTSLGSGPNDIIRIGGNGLVFENNEVNVSVDNFGIGIQQFKNNLFTSITKNSMLLINPTTSYQSTVFVDNNVFITSYPSSIITCYGGTTDSKLYVSNNKVLSDYIGSKTEIQFILHDVTGLYSGNIMLSNNLDSNGEIMQSRELLSKTIKSGVKPINLSSGFDIKINPNKLNSWYGPNFSIFNFNILCEDPSGTTKLLDFSVAIGKINSIATLKSADIIITGTNASEVNVSLVNNNYTLHIGFIGSYNTGLPTALKYEIFNAVSGSYFLD